MRNIFSKKQKDAPASGGQTPGRGKRSFYTKPLAFLDVAAGSAFAFLSIPSLTGLLGAAKAVAIGVGMTVGGLLAAPAALVGLVAGGGLGALLGRKGKSVVTGALIGAASFGIGGGVAGNVIGYKVMKKLLVKEAAAPAFNKAAQPKAAAGKTYVVPPQYFQKCRMY